MGMRSWLSPVRNKEEWDEAKKSIEKNPYGYGMYYAIEIKKPLLGYFKKGELYIAWSGDGSSSLNDLTPAYSRVNSILLDNLSDEYPSYNVDPNKFGTLYDPRLDYPLKDKSK